MDRWVRDGKEPPASQYPRIAQDTLVPLGAVQFPKIPGVSLPAHIQKAYRADYGPEFRAAGIVTIEPPRVGTAFPILLPQVDRDGNDTSGVRMPEAWMRSPSTAVRNTGSYTAPATSKSPI